VTTDHSNAQSERIVTKPHAQKETTRGDGEGDKQYHPEEGEGSTVGVIAEEEEALEAIVESVDSEIAKEVIAEEAVDLEDNNSEDPMVPPVLLLLQGPQVSSAQAKELRGKHMSAPMADLPTEEEEEVIAVDLEATVEVEDLVTEVPVLPLPLQEVRGPR
jgi:hypothetical protein